MNAHQAAAYPCAKLDKTEKANQMIEDLIQASPMARAVSRGHV